MKKYIKRISYCSLVIILFFYMNTFVDAERFVIDSSKDCNTVSGCSPIPSNDTNPKYVNDGNNGMGAVAYCSDHDKLFYGLDQNGGLVQDNIEYVRDQHYADANNCVYNSHNNGDCSEIVGYIINESRNYYTSSRGYSPVGTWYWTQVTIWAYLAKYAPADLGLSNTRANDFYDNYSKIRTVIGNAWNKYANDTNNGLSSSGVYDDVNFQIQASDINFYYKPSTSSCNSGVYRTKEITLINNENRAINVTLSTNSDVSICRSTSSSCSQVLTTSVPRSSSLVFYLKSSVDSTEIITLTATASYESDFEVYSEYDSVRWIPANENISNAQGMFTFLTSGGISGVSTANHNSSIDTDFSKIGIQRKTCSNTGNFDSSNSSSNPTSKICASTNGSVDSDYTAEFEGCTCFGVDLGSDRYVNVIVDETATFRFGNLVPNDILYSGGGFSFANSGITTAYGVKVIWAYADTKNGVPYYYNGNNLGDSDATSISNLITQKILDTKLKSKVNLEFSTKDSNDSKNTDAFLIPLELEMENLNFANGSGEVGGSYEFNSGALMMEEAYFSTDGKVKYGESDESHNIFGGNKYYIPLDYAEDKFPFDINVTDLSIVNGIEFWYQGDCDKLVNNKYKSLYYRSIDVKNPFPKAGNDSSKVPENWRLWYCGDGSICSNSTNQLRMKNTYRDYPTDFIYRTVLDSQKVNQINGISSYYTNWSGINADGTSNFVTNLFESHNDNSYCKIGEFSEECDQ